MTLRGYKAGDFEAMFALDVTCFAATFRFTRPAMRRFAEAKKARVVLAEEAGQLVGFCVVHMERGDAGRVGYVVTLDVAEAARRRGVARSLMVEMERQVLAESGTAMWLHVFPGNEEAIRFYERMGYEGMRVDQDFYGAGLGALVYRKLLG